MKKVIYEEPISEILRFGVEDIITTSGGIGDNFGEAGEGDFD